MSLFTLNYGGHLHGFHQSLLIEFNLFSFIFALQFIVRVSSLLVFLVLFVFVLLLRLCLSLFSVLFLLVVVLLVFMLMLMLVFVLLSAEVVG